MRRKEVNSLPSAGRPRWQQMTALVSLSAGGAITGLSFVPKAAADFSSPTSMPLNLVALQQSAHPAHTARTAPGTDTTLRKAIVNVADYYLRMAESKSPAEMEAIIWQHDSIDGADHGQSCAAFASLTLELAAQVVGQQSWVSGGTSYPWPLHSWADVRVEANPASLGIISVQQDAEAQHRWHPLGDGYRPLPGDWVLFDGHVEVVTGDSDGVLRTVGGDSLPNFSVNAHEYRAPLSGAGVVGFVNNGSVPAPTGGAQQDASPSGGQAAPSSGGRSGSDAADQGGSAAGQDGPSSGAQSASSGGAGTAADAAAASAGGLAAIPGTQSVAPQNAGTRESGSRESGSREARSRKSGSREAGRPKAGRREASGSMSADRAPGAAAIPGLAVPAPRSGVATEKAATGGAVTAGAATGEASTGNAANRESGGGGVPGGKAAERTSARPAAAAARGDAAIPGLDAGTDLEPGHHDGTYRRHHPSPARRPVSETRVQQAFISEVAPGAMAAQHRYGVPAAVTIAQAIDESGWGQSELAAQDHNLFGIKGTGPAGSVPMPTQEYVNGQPVSTSASFRVYHDAAESIDDHGRLLARSGYYQQAMAEHHHPDKFAAALTGVYATDPNYGANLISLMRRYDLYRYSAPDTHRPDRAPAVARPGAAAIPGVSGTVTPPVQPGGSASPPVATPQPTRTARPNPTRTSVPEPTHTGSPSPTRTASPSPTGTASPNPTRTSVPEPTQTASPSPTRTASPDPTRTARPDPTRTGVPAPTGTASPAPSRTPAPEPSATGSPQPSRTRPPRRNATGSTKPGGTSTTPPSASPRPAAARSPQPTASKNRRATRAGSSPPTGSRPAPAPSASSAEADIPGITAQAESARPTTSAVSFGPGARFVPVNRSAPAPARAATPPRRSATARSAASPVRATLASTRRYQPHMPRSVLNAFVQTAKGPLLSEETLYRDVASFRGISWQLLAACDWMQCDARPRRSPVYGERLGSLNADGTVYTSRSAALARCADDLIRLAGTVYGIDLTGRRDLSVRDLANAFAAFRWGALLKAHDCSALEFPYSVAGLTDHHLGMRWPRIAAPGTGDRPGSRYRRAFGAVPIVLGLDYQATV
jgi:flagellum-specific peptidoglycan hydrolase FlgJ